MKIKKNKKAKDQAIAKRKVEIKDDVLKNISGGATSRNKARSNSGST